MPNGHSYYTKDYYKALGVPETATAAEIKKAYRKLAQKHHPDANAGDKTSEDRFKEVSEAYDTLGDPKKRAEYDQSRKLFGGNFRPGAGAGRGSYDFGDVFGGAGRPGPGGGGAGGFGGFGDLFDLITGGAGGTTRTQQQQPGADLSASVTISFEDAMRGVTTRVPVSRDSTCEKCHGTGAEPGHPPRYCATCSGKGTVEVNQGFFAFSQPCPTCHGRGTIIDKPCGRCRGAGVTPQTANLTVNIPAGVNDGAKLRLKGKGQAGRHGAPAGDLFLNVRVSPHSLFARDGSNITIHVPISFSEAALGTRLTVPTMEGPATIRVPPGTPSGHTFRMRGKGAPKLKGGSGDFLIVVDIAVPKRLSREEKALITELSKKTNGNELRKELSRYIQTAPKGSEEGGKK